MRNDGFIRQWKFLLALDAKHLGITLREAAEAARVSERTIRRDIDALILSGFPVEANTTESGTRFTLRRRGWRGLEGVVFPQGMQ